MFSCCSNDSSESSTLQWRFKAIHNDHSRELQVDGNFITVFIKKTTTTFYGLTAMDFVHALTTISLLFDFQFERQFDMVRHTTVRHTGR